MNADALLLRSQIRKTLVLQFNHPKSQNPLNEAMRLALCAALVEAEEDPSVAAIVLTGGVERSFCVGGDFAEVAEMNSPTAVQLWIERIIDLYIAILQVSKPVIIAIEGYAIGIGMQISLLGDWRVASHTSQHSMWELKVGVACTIGSCLVQHCFGRLAATRLIYGCQLLTAKQALDFGFVEDLVSDNTALRHAIERAEQFGAYPSVPFSATKRSMNAELIEALRQNKSISADAHTASFAAKSSDGHMSTILKR